MLPEHHHIDDRHWIRDQLAELDPKRRVKALQGYSEVYQLEYDKEPAGHKKENRARFAANMRLRTYIQAVKDSKQCTTTSQAQITTLDTAQS